MYTMGERFNWDDKRYIAYVFLTWKYLCGGQVDVVNANT